MTPEEHEARKLKRVQDSLDAALTLIANIRYQNWPKGAAEALSLDAEAMDVLLEEGELALRYSKRKRNP